MIAHNEPSSLPLAASRFLTRVAFWLTAVMAIFFLVLSIVLAVAWPQVMAKAVDQAMEMKIADVQPWISLVMFGACAILALAARLFDRLSRILGSVSQGDPFTVDNSRRLRHIGWLMIFMQVIGFLTGLAGNQMPAEHNFGEGFDLSFSGLLAAFLAFVVAQLFEQARGLRDELEGTI
jgi:hypothetical protein